MTIAKLSPWSHAVAIGSMILLSACGDDGSSSKGTEPTDDSASSSTVGDIMAGTFDDLPVCTAKREGVMAYVKDEKTAYVCEDGDWVIDSDVIPSSDPESSNGSAQSSSGNGKAKSSSSVKGKSSSSVIPSSAPESSSSLKVAALSSALSSSTEGRGSSSSVKTASSSSALSSSSWSSEGTIGFSSSNGKTKSSSSVKVALSSSVPSSASWSSEGTIGSSSSQKVAVSSSSSCEESSSSSSVELDCWAFGVNAPKECLFNKNIAYDSMTDTRDGQIYKTVKIGNQVWMAENLNYETDRSWCGGGRGRIQGDCSKYGRLYTWAVVTTVCPSGWHLPSNDEWNSLFTAVGGQSAGHNLKSQAGWSNRDSYDRVGFSALPAGCYSCTSYGEFDLVGEYAIFWSATQINDTYAYSMGLSHDSYGAELEYNSKITGVSVRCLKD